jgi:hypothetical protein
MVSLVAVATIVRCGPCVPYGYECGFLTLRGPHRPAWPASHAPPVAFGGILTATSRTLRDRPSGRSIVATAPALAPISA